ncbi:MAG: hypothetical protein IH624_05165 [Phycisphaerae bacterium]|nr:hypothetical protein [Phycisphaerae bacterium]
MSTDVVITGIGMVTPLGRSAEAVLNRILCHESAMTAAPFASGEFDCPVWAPVAGFDPEAYFPDNKMLRLMNRDAQMAVVAARLAMEDAAVRSGETYQADEIALFGSTGTAGMSAKEIARIVQHATREDGSLSLDRFGRVALKRVRPVLSFRILSNMPVCFVSIFENITGPNAVYTPWEGQGAQAIAAGVRAIRRGDVRCSVVGGCDVKCREVSFVSLQQSGVFDSWKRYGRGCIPGEGAAFIVLEERHSAVRRGIRPYALVKDFRMKSASSAAQREKVLCSILSEIKLQNGSCRLQVVGASDGDYAIDCSEEQALERAGIGQDAVLKTKSAIGNLFAGAAPVQVGLAAQLAAQERAGGVVIANCFGYGSEQAAFVLEAA